MDIQSQKDEISYYKQKLYTKREMLNQIIRNDIINLDSSYHITMEKKKLGLETELLQFRQELETGRNQIKEDYEERLKLYRNVIQKLQTPNILDQNTLLRLLSEKKISKVNNE